MPRLTDEEKTLLKRILNGFKHFGCFIYEADEHQKVMNVLKKIKIDNYLKITLADPRYPYIYLIKPKDVDLERDCIVKIDKLFREGRLSEDDYKARRDELIRQCINHYLYERLKEIMNIIEKMIKGDEDVRRILKELPWGNK